MPAGGQRQRRGRSAVEAVRLRLSSAPRFRRGDELAVAEERDGGAVGIVDNVEIVDRVEITAMTLVSQSILEQGRYSSGTGLMSGYKWKRSVVGFRKLDNILKRIKRLESGQ